MNTEQLQFLFSLFSFIGVIGILIYLILERSKADIKADRLELFESRVVSLQDYVYELEERLESNKKLTQDEIKDQIIEMYEAGKDLMVIENSLDVPRAKIEMVLKFHKLKTER